MCGIAMISGTGWSPSLWESILDGVQHRGTVTEQLISEDLAAATRRLPIVDREHGVQPWRFGEQGEYTLCYNGEIYNADALRSTLEDAGWAPSTASDTELLALSLAQWGEEAVDRVEGEFAFAVAVGGYVYVGRDPLGVKPLYYSAPEGHVCVASEVKSLIPTGAPIHEVPPGHHGWISEEYTTLAPYFDLAQSMEAFDGDMFTGTEEAVDAVRSAVIKAVESRVRTDLGVAVILSGGLDSTIVASLASRAHSGCTAYTIGTPDSPDIEYATRVAADLGLPHRVIEVKPSDIKRPEVLSTVASSELTEYGDIINAVISARLFREIGRDDFRVAIGGDCSDELFGGYPMYQDIPADQQRALFQYKLNMLSRTELQRVDRTSMASTVEARVPFLDRGLVEVALRVPGNMKVRDGQDKWILRRAFEGSIPDYVINRPKHGLSYSSGLHDRVRLYKPWMPVEYRRCGYAAHAPLRRDFDVSLAASGNDLTRLLEEDSAFSDMTLVERAKDLAGAVRWNLFPPRSVRKTG